MFTEPMLRLFAIVIGRDAEKVTEALLMSGAVQFIASHDFPVGTSGAGLHDVPLPAESAIRINETRKRIEQFLDTVGIVPTIPPETDTAASPPSDPDAINRELDGIAVDLQKVRDRQRLLQTDILKYEEISRQIGLYGPDFSPASLNSHYSYVTMQIGSIPASGIASLQEQLQQHPSVIQQLGDVGKRTHLIVISMKRDKNQVTSLLAENGWEPLELSTELKGTGNDIRTAINEKLTALKQEQQKLLEQGHSIVTGKKTLLSGHWTALRIDELRLRIRSAFKQTSRTVLFSGWVPSSQRQTISELLTSTTGGRCHIEWLSPDHSSDLQEQRQEAPVKFDNPKLFAPFEMLVSNFGIPEYGTIDPTPFVVFTYLVMFGLMFADIGQGALLMAGGIAGTIFMKKQNQTGLRRLATLLIWCGGASVVFGALFGSVFGYSIIKPLWFDFHGIITGHARPSVGISSIYDILGITVKFGIGVIGCGLLFNWINLCIKRRWSELLFDKGGIPGGWIYAGGIYCASYLISHDYKGLPGTPVLIVGLLLPALMLFFKAPLHARAHHEPFSGMSLVNFGMEWIVELLEVFGGYLSNTLSFMRVAGLGIAHVSLMVAFFTMADMVRGPRPGIAASIAAVLLIIAGNIMVIVLEGLSAGIQSLRLNYYEFFTKFFHGTGSRYQPVRLKEP